MNEQFWRWGAEKQAAGQRLACLLVTETDGSSPATPGQLLLVAEDGQTFGTVGGGASEFALIQRAQKALAANEAVFAFALDHAEAGMSCGGSMRGSGTVLGSQAKLLIFGGGHIAQSLAKVATLSGFELCVVEDRAEFSSAFGGGDYRVDYRCLSPADYGALLPISPRTYAVICTRGHLLDREALRFCLEQPFKYLGMIGSRKKVAEVFAQLRAEGVTEEKLRRVYAPIGLDIASGSPQEIAIAVLAEMLLVKNNGSPRHKSERTVEE